MKEEPDDMSDSSEGNGVTVPEKTILNDKIKQEKGKDDDEDDDSAESEDDEEWEEVEGE